MKYGNKWVSQFKFEKQSIAGHAVDFPLFFMKDEDLGTFAMNQK